MRAAGRTGPSLSRSSKAAFYRLQIRAAGFFFLPELVQLSESLTGQVWSLAAAGGRIQGQVAGLAPGQFRDVRILARPAAEAADGPMGMFLAGGFSPVEDEETPHRSEVDALGRFAIEGLWPGNGP